jgi:hypothetical protein
MKKPSLKKPESLGEALIVGSFCLLCVLALLVVFHQLLFKSWEYEHPWLVAATATTVVILLLKLALLGDPNGHVPIEKRSRLTRWLLED